MNNVSLQTIVSLERNFSNFSYISFLSVNFENLTFEFNAIVWRETFQTSHISFLSVNFENLTFEFNVPYVLNGTVNEPSFVE